uniref:Flap endonuclease 1 n=1 Tax=Lygus hesperus TaxID=30085 RepID=A0A0A9WVD1_LYGHE
MKYFAVLLLASLCVAVYSAEIQPRGIKSSVVNAANKLKSAVSSALSVAKGKLNEFVKALGEQKGPAINKINEMKEQLQAEAKAVLAQAVDQAQKQAAAKIVGEINKVIGELNNAKDKIEKLN